jgi:hypothetical protein
MKRRIREILLAIWALAILAGMLIGGEIALHFTDTFRQLLAGLAVSK